MGRRTGGEERAKALAFVGLTAQYYQPDVAIRYGCGVMNLRGCHGDRRNEFYVYKLERFLERYDRVTIDHMCETFVPAKTFCWNCALVSEGYEYEHWKCLGRSLGEHDVVTPGHIVYADQTVGLVRAC